MRIDWPLRPEWYHYKKRARGPDTVADRGEGHVETEAEIGVMQLQAME